MIGRHGSRRSGGSASVSIHVRDLAQLFNSLDPSPFWDRDLDRDAATFIEEEFSEKRSASVWHLNVHVHGGEALADDLQKAIKNYYTRLAGSAQSQLREHMRLGELGLLGGMVIFILCMGVRQLLQGTLEHLPRALDEGLIILAWLALWRPAEAVAYEWVPLYRKRRLFERLAAIRVSVRSEPPAVTSGESKEAHVTPQAAHG
jgi:hypothetical protein